MEVNNLGLDVVFSKSFLKFYMPFHQKYSGWQQNLKKMRKSSLDNVNFYSAGHIEHASLKSDKSDYRIDDFPAWCEDQRNQMTGPADDSKLIVKMMNSKAPGVMIDLEDSMANNKDSLWLAYNNIMDIFQGTINYYDSKKNLTVKIDSDVPTVLWIRPRGLHMDQIINFPEVLSEITTSATLLDVCIAAYHFDNQNLPCSDQSLAFYIPKTEIIEESEWWESLFKDLAKVKRWEPNAVKCMALVESYPMAHIMDQFIYNLKDHILGLNLGRWDYMASLIEYKMSQSDWVLPDRNKIPHDVNFFQSLRKHIVNVCHARNILAIGGMTALFPSRGDPELNKKALQILEQDKKNEAEMGMDGAWTGHPDQNEIAIAQFTLKERKVSSWDPTPKLDDNSDFRHDMVTPEGTKEAIRVCIRYRNGVLKGKGASLLDGYMEDLATDRICRLMIAQRIIHNIHSSSTVASYFSQELEKLLKQYPEDSETLTKASELTQTYIYNNTHTPR